MIHVKLAKLTRPPGWDDTAAKLLVALKAEDETTRSSFIDKCCGQTWGHPALLAALRCLVGNKCWYSEVPLDGSDPNVDHFRPKGRVREVDANLKPIKDALPGYWWWAFEWRNFRLASMHANQRRVDVETNGGKADYFPVNGTRAAPETDYSICVEDAIPLDPCIQTDVALLWFDADGAPSCSNWQRKKSPEDEWRVKVSIWLYHLDKREIVARRRAHMDEVRSELINADADHRLWKGTPKNIGSKMSFERRLDTIKKKIADDSEFAGAKRAAVRAAAADYPWILEYGLA